MLSLKIQLKVNQIMSILYRHFATLNPTYNLHESSSKINSISCVCWLRSIFCLSSTEICLSRSFFFKLPRTISGHFHESFKRLN